PQHLGAERRAAHPAEDDVVDFLVQRLGEASDVAEPLLDMQRLVEPAEPLRLVAAGPYGRVTLPDSFDESVPLHRLTRRRPRASPAPRRATPRKCRRT